MALVVSRREESKTDLSIKNRPREVGFHQDPGNPPISQVHMPFKILARDPVIRPGARAQLLLPRQRGGGTEETSRHLRFFPSGGRSQD